MRMRNNKNANEELLAFSKYIENSEDLQTILNKYKSKKIYLEIGMGKGDFITNLSYKDMDNIYIGVELSKSVLALACKKIKKFEEEKNTQLTNLYVMSFDALNLDKIFKKAQIEKIYLNFSDPWPKKRHTKRRLTYEDFLKQYKYVLKKDGTVEFKTDNRGLFEYSLVSIQNFGSTFLEVYLDLHKNEKVENILTEYEKKFSKLGPIYKLVFKI